MGDDEARVGVLRDQRLEHDPVLRALQLPPAPHAAGLQQPQHLLVPAVDGRWSVSRTQRV